MKPGILAFRIIATQIVEFDINFPIAWLRNSKMRRDTDSWLELVSANALPPHGLFWARRCEQKDSRLRHEIAAYIKSKLGQ